jgi:uncharacterized protein YcbK (DUF882 family)
MRAKFIERVVTLLEIYPGSVTSWIRSHKRNREVGGSKASWHLAGLAVDIVLDEMEESNRISMVQRARRIGLDAIDEIDHIHLEVPQ